MNRLTPEEQIEQRLSAYLDGELSADETAVVEQLLAERDDLRRLHDELLAVRANLKALYQHRLEADFSQRVLRQAERAVLSRSAAGSHPRADAAGEFSENGAASRRRMPRPFSSVRSWLWAGAAIAAAVVLMMNQPEQEGPQGEAGDEQLAQRHEEDDVLLRETSTKTAIAAKGRLQQAKVGRFAAPQDAATPDAASISAVPNDAAEPEAPAAVGVADRSRIDRLRQNLPGKALRGESRPPVARYDFLVDRKTADSGAIEKLLAQRKIALAAAPPAGSTPDGVREAAKATLKSPTQRAADPTRQRFEVIYLQGPPQQIEAVLLALRSQPGFKRSGASDEEFAAAGPGDRQRASDVLPARRKLGLASTAGRAWRDEGEARSLAERYANRRAPFGAAKKFKKAGKDKVDRDAPLGRGGDPGDSATAKKRDQDETDEEAEAKGTSAGGDPAWVTVMLVFRLIDPAGEAPHSSDVESRD